MHRQGDGPLLMDTITTICLVSHDALHALELCVESFRKYHSEPVRWHICDNGSEDGACEYAETVADVMLYGARQASHGESLTYLVQTVQTPYFLALDNDIEFTGPVLDMLRDALEPEHEAYCACLTRLYAWGKFDIGGVVMDPLWSPNIAVGLLKTDMVKRLLAPIEKDGRPLSTFGYWQNSERREHGETGAMVYRMALAAGYKLVELPELWERVIHHGSLSAMFNQAERDPVLVERYEKVKQHLRELREATMAGEIGRG